MINSKFVRLLKQTKTGLLKGSLHWGCIKRYVQYVIGCVRLHNVSITKPLTAKFCSSAYLINTGPNVEREFSLEIIANQ